MKDPSEFLVGVIEGFYGLAWPFETRRAYAGYLAHMGLNTCLYCPKSDVYLRKRWQLHWPADEWQQLMSLSAVYRQCAVNWGVGLSPFALYRNYGPVQRKQLRQKVDQLAQLEAPLLAILFDDMPGDLDALASRQAEIVSDVVRWLPGARILVCPTYYSFDPVLEQYFGRMPVDYWPQLGRELPAGVDIFWTGNRVCSDSISNADIEAICGQLGRPVILWDNYPVNDGAQRSKFLYWSKPPGRESLSGELLNGHLCNAMNQGLLSLPALAGLATLYSGMPVDDDWLSTTLGRQTWRQLLLDREAFEHSGLAGIGEQRCLQLAQRYQQFGDPAGREIAAWLRGEYTFDPACLTG
jgi:hyaluronoglucosaminidase